MYSEALVPRVAISVRDWMEFIVGKCVLVVTLPTQSKCVDDSLCPVYWRCRVLTLVLRTMLWCICGECSDSRQADSIQTSSFEGPKAGTDHCKMLLNLSDLIKRASRLWTAIRAECLVGPSFIPQLGSRKAGAYAIMRAIIHTS